MFFFLLSVFVLLFFRSFVFFYQMGKIFPVIHISRALPVAEKERKGNKHERKNKERDPSFSSFVLFFSSSLLSCFSYKPPFTYIAYSASKVNAAFRVRLETVLRTFVIDLFLIPLSLLFFMSFFPHPSLFFPLFFHYHSLTQLPQSTWHSEWAASGRSGHVRCWSRSASDSRWPAGTPDHRPADTNVRYGRGTEERRREKERKWNGKKKKHTLNVPGKMKQAKNKAGWNEPYGISTFETLTESLAASNEPPYCTKARKVREEWVMNR